MIATVRAKLGDPCIVRWTGRQGLSAIAQTYCGLKANAADGVEQVPDNSKVCTTCDGVVKKLEATLTPTTS